MLGGAVGLLAAGLILRGLAPGVLLFPGTALAAAAIALLSVLLPSLVKRRAPERAGLLIGLYLLSLSAGSIRLADRGAGLQRLRRLGPAVPGHMGAARAGRRGGLAAAAEIPDGAPSRGGAAGIARVRSRERPALRAARAGSPASR